MPVLTLFVALSLASLQSPTAFDGSWIAEYRGTTHIRLTLQTVNGVTSGTISLGDLQVDDSGAIEEASEAPKQMKPLVDVRRVGAVLQCGLKDGEDTDHFQLAIAGDGLELTFLLTDEERREFAAEGIPVPKPVKLRRVK